MLYSKDRQEMRGVFREAWRKYQAKEPMEKLESLIAELIATHPRYQAAVENLDHDDGVDQALSQQAFMHLSLHLAIREQVSMNQPFGITMLYQQACQKSKTDGEAEHILMDALHEMMIRAQSAPGGLDDQLYLRLIQQRLAK